MTGRGSTQSAGEVVGHLGPAVCCYLGFLAAAACGQWLARTPGVTITFWPPNGVLLASLLLVGRPVWPSLLAAGFCAELTSNALWFGNSLPMASIYYAVNATECLVAAWLLRSFFPLPARLRTLRQVLALIVLGVGVAPIVGATLGSLVDLAIGKHAFMQAWPLWWIGDAAGTMIAMPLTLVVVEIWMDRPHLSRGEIMEAIIVGGVLLTIGVLALDTYLPFAYIIMPPLLWASVRFNFAGAVFSSAGLAAMVAVFATVGAPQFGGDTISQGTST